MSIYRNYIHLWQFPIMDMVSILGKSVSFYTWTCSKFGLSIHGHGFYTWSLSDLPYMVTKPPYDHEKYMSKLPERYFF